MPKHLILKLWKFYEFTVKENPEGGTHMPFFPHEWSVQMPRYSDVQEVSSVTNNQDCIILTDQRSALCIKEWYHNSKDETYNQRGNSQENDCLRRSPYLLSWRKTCPQTFSPEFLSICEHNSWKKTACYRPSERSNAQIFRRTRSQLGDKKSRVHHINWSALSPLH